MDQVPIKKQRLYYAALAVAILNPILSGLILGIAMLREPNLKHEGRIVLMFSVVWGTLVLLLVGKYNSQIVSFFQN
ncbi:MAG: hypothetical protein HY220_00320 [Candidatus Sungbacteria bacterium]|uniref:Uncharacterized protein n=1 Tax=Candidatus Sungiibacteriota bacterium TaxID=2750080 RepID=A0A9D6LQY1_9BACT|nr:hypothetical protein [Candidatus Sungbacteria bacterium]